MTEKTAGSGDRRPTSRSTVPLALRGRLNRRRSDREGQPALAEELASALALAELTHGMEPALRAQLIRRAARRLHPSGLETPPEGSH